MMTARISEHRLARAALNAKLSPDQALVVSLRCPNCGRADAIVFPQFSSGDGPRPDRSTLVCLACCPRASGHS